MFQPTTLPNRIHAIDILRGFALLGIGVVNVLGFNASFFDFGGFYNSMEDSTQLNFYQTFISLTADKFIFIFSFLFGYGVYLQFQKFAFNDLQFKPFFERRMFYLALFGVAHILLLWAGDILLLYALGGMFLFLFRKSLNWVLIPMAFVFYFFIPIWLLVSVWITLPNALSSTCNDCLNDALSVYPVADYWQCLKLRITEYAAFRNINLFYYLPKAIGVFFLGYFASRWKMHERIAKELKVSLIVLTIIGLAAVITWRYYEQVVLWIVPEGSVFLNAVYMAGYELMNILVAVTYIMIILILSSVSRIRNILMPLSYVGRMSLTNYIFQSIVFSVIFYGWGLGQFGMQQPSVLVAYAVILFVFQVLISYLWLKFNRQGPLEALWRNLSYKRISQNYKT